MSLTRALSFYYAIITMSIMKGCVYNEKKIFEMTEEEKQKFIKISGSILLWIGEGRSIKYMSDKLNLSHSQVKFNIDETLYDLKKQVGLLHYLKILFMK